jgi:hypothetical protein
MANESIEPDTDQCSGAGDQRGRVEAKSCERGRASKRAVAAQIGECKPPREYGGERGRERLTMVGPARRNDLGVAGLGRGRVGLGHLA